MRIHLVTEKTLPVSIPMNKQHLLVVDDDKNIRTLISHTLESEGYQVTEAQDGMEAVELASKMSFDAVLLDLQMPRMNGREALKELKKAHPELQCLMISAVGTIDDAVSAMSDGAFWFIQKPFEPEELLGLVGKALEVSSLRKENSKLKQSISNPSLPANFFGVSKEIDQVRAQALKVAPLDSSVLISGPSGTGKSTLARLIHQNGPRADKPFVAVSCAALPRDLIEAEFFGHEKGAFTGASSSRVGKIEVADGGTLFLDEIGDMPLDLQPKLLTFLQDRTFQRVGSSSDRSVDVRIIAATHQNLEKMCAEGAFREDLFYRVNVLRIDVPGLGERPKDVKELATKWLEKNSHKFGGNHKSLSPEAAETLGKYSWPGNVRELENMMERACAFSDSEVLGPEDFKLSLTKDKKTSIKNLSGMTLEELEKLAVIQTLEACDGSRNKAAEMLGVSLKSIYNKVKKYELD